MFALRRTRFWRIRTFLITNTRIWLYLITRNIAAGIAALAFDIPFGNFVLFIRIIRTQITAFAVRFRIRTQLVLVQNPSVAALAHIIRIFFLTGLFIVGFAALINLLSVGTFFVGILRNRTIFNFGLVAVIRTPLRRIAFQIMAVMRA